nr:MAG TPA: hypothetical protein [Bacteriophage sp.]
MLTIHTNSFSYSSLLVIFMYLIQQITSCYTIYG